MAKLLAVQTARRSDLLSNPVEQPRKVSDFVTSSIRDAIIAGRLPAGSPLGLVDLAQKLGVSTTPVREALTRLEEEGIVRGTAHRSFRVAELTLEDIRDFHRLHAFASAELAVRASSCLTRDDFEALESLHREINAAFAASDYAAMHSLNFEFHRRINISAPPGVLHRTVRATTRYISRRSYPDVPGWLERAAVDHHSILEALRDKDTARIRDVVTNHVMTSGEQLIADFRKQGNWRESPGQAPFPDSDVSLDSPRSKGSQ